MAWYWTLASGVGLFLYGMRLTAEALAAAAARRARRRLARLDDRPLLAVALGAGVTALLQSSSAATVMVLGLVHGGLLNLRGAAAVIMGANVGTTLTAQLVAFPIEGLALPLLAVGAPLLLAAGGRRPAAALPMSFGILLLGLSFIGESTAPLAADPRVLGMLHEVAGQPLLGLLAGTALTTLLDSSSASIALLQRLAGAGLIDLGGALPVVFGDNIGTTTATLAASLTLNRDARRVAVVHLLFNAAGAFCLWPLTWWLPHLLPGITADPARQIAHAHTIFNTAATLLFLPVRGVLLTAARGLVQ